jgi:hypothetical protein
MNETAPKTTATTTTRVIATVLMFTLLGGSLFVAQRVPIPKELPTVAWNSAWVFRGEVFAGFFIAAYVLLLIVLSTILSGQPPRKLSFGLLAVEDASMTNTAVAALSEGGAALQAVESEVRSLDDRLTEVIVATRAAHEALVDVARVLPERGDEIERRAQAQIEALSAPPSKPDESRLEFEKAMTRFDHLLSDLEKLKAKAKA